MPYLHNRGIYSLESLYYPSWKYLCTVVSFSEACFIIEILQRIKISPFKLKTIFYENDTLPVKNPIYSRYGGQKIDAIIIDDTKSKRRSGGRPSIKGVVGLNLESGEKYLLYLGLSDSYSGVLSYLRENYRISEEIYAICDGDDVLQSHLKKDGYKIQQCTNHFVKTSMYYLWKENYPRKNRTRIRKDISRIISTLKNSVKKHSADRDFKRLEWRIDQTKMELLAIANEISATDKNSNAAKFIFRTYEKVTLFAELAMRDIIIPDNNNHIENLMGIVGQKVKKNHQSWVDDNLNKMLKIIWHIIS